MMMPFFSRLLHRCLSSFPSSRFYRYDVFKQAILQGSELTFQHLLKTSAAELNRPDAEGRTFLMEAASMSRPFWVQSLIDHGFDLHAKDALGWDALFFAGEQGHFPTLQVLLNAGLSPRNEDLSGETVLFKIIRSYDFYQHLNQSHLPHHSFQSALTALLKAGADLQHQNKQGLSLVLLACQLQQPSLALILIQAGADPLLPDLDGLTSWDLIQSQPSHPLYSVLTACRQQKQLTSSLILPTDADSLISEASSLRTRSGRL